MKDDNRLEAGPSLARRTLIAEVAAALGGLALVASAPRAVTGESVSRTGDAGTREDVSRSAESIHQEVVIAAMPARVYEALIDAAQFTKVTAFSSVPKARPAVIGRSAGESFSVFGGHIIGRQLELLPSQRIVQAWRIVDWSPGHYSIAKFELTNQGGQTRIVFDHTGFPVGKGDHLAEGWIANYWEPLRQYFA